MNLPFEVRYSLSINLMLSIVATITLIYVYFNRKTYPGVGYWVLGYIISLFSMFSLVLKNYVSREATLMLQNIPAFFYFVFIYIGFIHFYNMKKNYRFVTILSLLTITLVITFSFLYRQLLLQIFLLSISITLLSSRLAIINYIGSKKIFNKPSIWVSCVFAVIALVYVARDISIAIDIYKFPDQQQIQAPHFNPASNLHQPVPRDIQSPPPGRNPHPNNMTDRRSSPPPPLNNSSPRPGNSNTQHHFIPLLLSNLSWFGSIVIMVALILLISERSNNDLIQSSSRYQRLTEEIQSDIKYFSHDLDGNFIYASPNLIEDWGDSENIIGKNWHDLYEPDDISMKTMEKIDSQCINGKSPLPFEYIYIHPQKGKQILEILKKPLIDKSGEVIAIEGMAKTVTERNLIFEKDGSESSQVKKLSGLLPICSSCKRIRTADNKWSSVEVYISSNSEADFTHSMCPDCIQKLYPGYAHKVLKDT